MPLEALSRKEARMGEQRAYCLLIKRDPIGNKQQRITQTLSFWFHF